MKVGTPVTIKPKALDTLILLVEHRGRLLEKEELMNRLWPDTAVEEANLTQNIFEVRRALARDPTLAAGCGEMAVAYQLLENVLYPSLDN